MQAEGFNQSKRNAKQIGQTSVAKRGSSTYAYLDSDVVDDLGNPDIFKW